MVPERNAPCPCGSGKKYKVCCLGTVSKRPAQDLWRRLNRIDAELANALLEHAKESLPPKALAEAPIDFHGGDDTKEIPDRDLQMFVPWMLYSRAPSEQLWRASRKGGGRPLTIAADYLSRHGTQLDELSRRYAEAAVREPFSFYAAERVDPGASIDFVDLLRERSFHVSERSGSRVIGPNDIVWAHLVTLEGLTTISGAVSYTHLTLPTKA